MGSATIADGSDHAAHAGALLDALAGAEEEAAGVEEAGVEEEQVGHAEEAGGPDERVSLRDEEDEEQDRTKPTAAPRQALVMRLTVRSPSGTESRARRS